MMIIHASPKSSRIKSLSVNPSFYLYLRIEMPMSDETKMKMIASIASEIEK